MDDQYDVVLPDTLVAQLIDNAVTLSSHLTSDFQQIGANRDALRRELIALQRIRRLVAGFDPIREAYAIDGAHIAEIDRASAYSVSCAVQVGRELDQNGQSSCLSILPHVPSLNSLSTGLMMMQEIMMAVSVVENVPGAVCFIDGSRISAIINIQQFYSSIERDLPHQLNRWRQEAKLDSTRQPGRLITDFEKRDWLTPYLTDPRIVGNVKLVTTTTLIEKHIPEWIGRFDDKTFAASVLEEGEYIAPEPVPPPGEPYHVHRSYPFSGNVSEISDSMTEAGNPHQLYQLYFRPNSSHGVFKIELNRSLLQNPEFVASILEYWRYDLPAPDIQEPYSFYIADRFAKEAVSVAKSALQEIVRRDTESASWAWFFTQPYRTQ